jgi:hypothetical protein
MKYGIIGAALLATAFIAGCDKNEGGAEGAKPGAEAAKAGAAAGTGVKECDDYFAAVEKCVKVMPAEAKAGLDQAAKTIRDTLTAAGSPEAKQAMGASCKSALDALAANPACK